MESVNQQLELTKCKYHVMHYDFKPSGEPQMVIEPQPPTHLTVTNATNQPVHITHVPSDQALQYLGCHKCPMNQNKQEQVLTSQCKDFARKVISSHLTRRMTNMFYSGIYIPSVGYCLPMTYFTKKELEAIQRPAHRAMLSRLASIVTQPTKLSLHLETKDVLNFIICLMVKALVRPPFS